MGTYIMRRLLLIIPTLIMVSLIVFSLIRFLPGDVVDLMFEEAKYAESMQALRHKLGLDEPIHVQYGKFIWNIVHGNFGESLWTKRTALEELRYRLPVTGELGILTILITISFAIPIGIIAAIRQDTAPDYILRSAAILGLSVPPFWPAIIVIVFGAKWFGWTPNFTYVSFFEDPMRNLSQFMVPALILGLGRSAVVMRMTRSMMLEVLRQDYIRTAWAKGLRERTVIYRHALKNAMIPVITIIGLQIPFIVGGSVIMESIFVLPGMGQYMLEVILRRDYPMLQAINLFIAGFVLSINLIVDLSYGFLDPRIRLR